MKSNLEILLAVRSRCEKSRDEGLVTELCAEIYRMIPFKDSIWDRSRRHPLHRWIHSMLGNQYDTLENWLIRYGHATEDELWPLEEYSSLYDTPKALADQREANRKVMQTRINWLDWMIEQEEKSCAA